MITVVIVLLGHLEHGRVEQCGIRTGVLVDVALELGFLLVVLGLERRPMRFVVALFKPLVTFQLRTLDQALTLYCRIHEHRRPVAGHWLQRRYFLCRPLPVRRANDLQNL